MLRTIAPLTLLGLLLLTVGCTPWYTRYGFEERADLRSPDAHGRLVQIVAAGGQDGSRAAPYLVDAPADTIRPVHGQMIGYFATGCSVGTNIEGEVIVYNHTCDALEQVVSKIGTESIHSLRNINGYAAAVGIGTLGVYGREGIPTLIAGLTNSYAPVRQRSVEALGQVGVAEQRALDALAILERADENPEVRAAARRANLTLLSGLTPEEADELIASTQGRPPQAPAASAEATRREAPKPEDVVGQLRPNDIALVIGIEDYRGSLPDSTGARRDAQVFADLAETHLGLSRRNIIVLLDQQATRSSLEAYFEDWLPRNAREDGRVYIYFAGHGAPDPQTGEGFLVPWDGDPRFISRQGFNIDELTRSLRELPAAEVVLMMDSCFSGSGGRSLLAEGTRPLVPVQEIAVEPSDAQTRFTLMAAASADEVTGMTPDGEHGLFSYYLFEGIRGGADRNNDGRVTLGELADFVAGRVPDEARRDNRDQTPVSHFVPQSAVDADLVVFE